VSLFFEPGANLNVGAGLPAKAAGQPPQLLADTPLSQRRSKLEKNLKPVDASHWYARRTFLFVWLISTDEDT
jgi:hypothetical protein